MKKGENPQYDQYDNINSYEYEGYYNEDYENQANCEVFQNEETHISLHLAYLLID